MGFDQGTFDRYRPVVAAGVALASSYSRTRTKTRKRSRTNMGQGYANTVSRSRVRTGRRKRDSIRTLKRDIIGGGDEIVFRWQQTSPSYLGPGRMALGWYFNPATTEYECPIHFMSLTNCVQGLSNSAKGCRHPGMHRVSYQRANGDFIISHLPSQVASGGADDMSGLWQLDSGVPHGPSAMNGRMFHKYTQIKLNLYGTYAVPINYKVMLVQLPSKLDIFGAAQPFISEGSECANMLKDWFRALTYSSVGNCNGRQDWVKDVRIVKQFSCTIQPLDYSNQLAEQQLDLGGDYDDPSKTPHIRELRWFIRHDRFRNYKWSENADETTENRFMMTGWDVNQPNPSMTDVEWGKKLFLVIQASSPKYDTKGIMFPYHEDVNTGIHGSYDVCIRNCFRTFAS